MTFFLNDKNKSECDHLIINLNFIDFELRSVSKGHYIIYSEVGFQTPFTHPTFAFKFLRCYIHNFYC